MLKNKKQILLIVAVVALYAAIALRFKDFVGQEEYTSSGKTWKIESIEADTRMEYTLSLDYPDPFKVKRSYRSTIRKSSNLAERHVTRQGKRTVRTQSSPQNTPVITPIKLQLIGTINVEDNSKDMCIIEIDNKEHVLKKGDSLRGIRIQNIFHDSVVVEQNKQRYTYKTQSK